ncbi:MULTISPECIES: NAD(P)/FAD-dependent oxidoreductase [unclassified Undibacterium]|uniref:NAD(P)/FAD-dependent oxidoreductase n=2 Tax=Oxalobacteraceae TaxID=75682 RepID=UPI002AC8FDD1|nr:MULTISPECIES: NAD(P)/FAD-dependent oxidoreductase [unclassified Undibacterium]MEB0137634.1 NAD(P)/FAD-dependent oxidoreductase [Undibacterium sp. CCC2.1]MEB0170635.1 NAD(P)/FAD-dependent oxidoreductase [Undibacterium sp. CCC1.1]MEB0174576.1 NAD(P)/FAD-dependent oxidoreductase [Undibacterium sp. CCC3.4]MEB0213627.1 NAD(P)/FAD-dependent oxidoreductase [Undibacterium sp. 5I2]WPX43796.1 NAD(P)/FAD-dependent oxidoreductase [Undibacterium sp. CCC3.4]
MNQQYDVAVIGAGAAGMMCAAVAAARGRRVVLIDHATRLAEKIRISGGGRCNFTNLETGPANFLSDNPHFCKSALSRYTPQDFLALLKRHGVAWHEKHKGQLFCDDSAEDIIRVLKTECDRAGVSWRMPCSVAAVAPAAAGGFVLETATGSIAVSSVVIASGGLSIPKIGATDFAHQIARQFGLKVIEPRPALVPLSFALRDWEAFVPLAGIALAVTVETGEKKQRALFREDILFTHRGLSGPGILQISSFWQAGAPIRLNLLPDCELAAELIAAKSSSKKNLANYLAQYLPQRLADGLLAAHGFDGQQKIADMQDKRLRELGQKINQWEIVPDGSEGYRKAEVTRGGVDTRALSQQSMMANAVPGLYFIGEAIDVTGWLGGYNFQWAWASGSAAGQAV